MIEILSKIQAELKSPKDKDNNFAGFKYRKAEDILAAVKPMLKDHDCVILLDTGIELIGDRYYIKATATLKKGESEISVSALAREEETKKGMDGSQITGSATSYARKYALAGLFAVDNENDADQDENGSREETPPRKYYKPGSLSNAAPPVAPNKKPAPGPAPQAAAKGNPAPQSTHPLNEKSPGDFVNIIFTRGYESAINDHRAANLFDALANYIKVNNLGLDIPTEKDKEAIGFMFNFIVSLEPNKISPEVEKYLSTTFENSPFEGDKKAPPKDAPKKQADFRQAPEGPNEKPLITDAFLETVQEAILIMEEGKLTAKETAEFIKNWLPVVSKMLNKTVSMDKLKDGLYELADLVEKTSDKEE